MSPISRHVRGPAGNQSQHPLGRPARLVCIPEVLNNRRPALWHNNRNKIEAARLVGLRVAGEEDASSPLHPSPFRGRYRFQRILKIGAGSRLSLHKNQRIAVSSYDVQLTQLAPEVACYDLVFAAFQELDRDAFAARTQIACFITPTKRPGQAPRLSFDGRELHEVCEPSRRDGVGRRVLRGALFRAAEHLPRLH